MQPFTEHYLAHFAFIDKLCAKRHALITANMAAIHALRTSHNICSEIDELVPIAKDAHPDSMMNIYFTPKGCISEYFKALPRFSKFSASGNLDIEEAIRIEVDSHLWLMLFNRLNVNELLASSTKSKIYNDLKSNCVAFTAENVETTFRELFNHREDALINSLYETVRDADTSYASNSDRCFKRRTVFTQALHHTNGCYYTVNQHGPFRDMLKFLSYFVFGERIKSLDGIQIDRDYLFTLVAKYFDQRPDDISDADSVISFNGGEMRFFKNCNCHLILEPSMVNLLNAFLSKSKALAAS